MAGSACSETRPVDPMLTFCSAVPSGALPQARVLSDALEREYPDARVVVHECGRGDRAWLRPTALLRALEEGAELAVYLDPELYVYASLVDALALAGKRGIVLVRRADVLPEDGLRPNYSDLLAAGVISPSFVAVSRSADGESFVRWWAERAARPGEAGANWLDLARDLFPQAAILEDPGSNVSRWNLHERPLERRDGLLLAGGRPLRFVDFSGFRPDRPYVLGEAATRVRVVDQPVLAELCGEYAERVRDAGWTAPPTELGSATRLGNGLPMDELIRALWTEAAAEGSDFGDVQSPIAADAFVSWLREPAQPGGATAVNRYLLAVYRRRDDLQRSFPELDGPDGEGLVAWAWEYGRGELDLRPQLLPPRPDQAVLTVDDLAVNVIGYLEDTLGIAEAARLYIESLTAAGVPVCTSAVSPDPAGGVTRAGHGQRQFRLEGLKPVFNLACVNGDQLAVLARTRGRELLGGRPTIGQWAWETDVLPSSWRPAFELVDEIWVNSSFVADNIGRHSSVPVVVVPQAIVVDDPAGGESPLADDGRFTYLFMLDFFSTLRRKNALGLVDAFTRAFRPGEGPRLLIKTINAGFHPGHADQLRARIAGRSDIELRDGFLDRREKAALIAGVDCYVSLHRSEGFGLTLAESMALGTPVITTGYSGNMDFTSERNSYLVDWEPTKVGRDCDIYPADGVWAEPDLDHAAALMRTVIEQPTDAREKAQRAKLDIQRMYAPAVAGSIARARLERLWRGESGPVRGGRARGSFRAVEEQLDFDLALGARGGPSGALGAGRRAILRLMRPFTAHERRLDRTLLDALRELRRDLEQRRSEVLRDSRSLSNEHPPADREYRQDDRDRHEHPPHSA